MSDLPNLGLATNNELVAELAARYSLGNTAGDYRTVDGEALAEPLSPAPPPGEPSTWLPDDVADEPADEAPQTVVVIAQQVELPPTYAPCSPDNRHTAICRCDGRGIIPGPTGHARACDCPDCAVTA
jgi:hypothetical protein